MNFGRGITWHIFLNLWRTDSVRHFEILTFYVAFLFLLPHMFLVAFTSTLVAAFNMDVQHGQDVVGTVAPPTAPGQTVAGSGRLKGQSNFKGDEDLKLATAYTFVALDAAVGTDQDCSTFWNKIRQHFLKKGGGVERNANSLKNRFNKVLQFEVQKFLGFLHGALREFHSGWNMDDYVTEAKKLFLTRMKKAFKHELVYNILKKDMAKFQLDLKSVDARVVRALFLLDSDAELADAAAAVDGIVAPRAGGVLPVVLASSFLTPRPSIGKRKAKEIEFKRQSIAKKGIVVAAAPGATVVQISTQLEEDVLRSRALNRLAAAAEAKNTLQNTLQQDQLRMQQDQLRMQQEQMCMQVYLQNPTSEISRAFFDAIGQKYIQVFAPAQVVNLGNDNSTNNNIDFLSVDTNTNHQHIKKVVVSPLLDACEKVVEATVRVTTTAPAVVVVKLEKEASCNVYHYDSSDSDDDVVVLGSTGGTLPNTQRLMAHMAAVYPDLNLMTRDDDDEHCNDDHRVRALCVTTTAPAVVVVKMENEAASRNVYQYDSSDSDNEVVVLGSTGGTLPDTQRLMAHMAAMYPDSQVTTLDDDNEHCDADHPVRAPHWWPRAPMTDITK